jgi:GAF domain-containing protein
MIKFLRSFFYTPLESDPAFQSIVVRIIAVALAGLATVTVLVGLAQNNSAGAVMLGLAVIVTAIGLAAAYRGYILLGRILVPSVLLLAFAYVAFNTYSLHDVSMLGFPAVILLAGLLLGTRGSLTYAILASVIADFLAYADLHGITTTFVGKTTGYDDMLIVPSILIITALMLNLLIRRLDLLVERARRSEQQEAAANQELRDLQGQLEHRVALRTEQLRASTDVGRAAVSILDTNQLLREIVNLITDRFGFYYTAVFLTDSTGRWAVLREATGEAGTILKERKHRLEIGGQSMVGTAMKTRKARIALDVGAEAVRFANPLLPDTRSEIALPLAVGSLVIGALDVQSTQMAAFDEASAAVLQSMADQIAIALSNTLQFQQAQTTLQRTRQLYEASTALANAENAPDVLNELMTHVLTDASLAQILIYGPVDETGQYAYLEVAASWTPHGSGQAPPVGTRMASEQTLRIPAMANEPYIIRDAADPVVSRDQQQFMQAMGMRAMLGYALVAGSQPVGLLQIAFREPHMFTQAETQSLQALSGQIAVTLSNQQLVREQILARQQLDEINRRLTGQVWRQYVRDRRQAVRKIDSGPGVPQETDAPGFPSELSVPVLIHGQEIGTLRLEDAASDRAWTSSEKALVQAVAGEVAIAIENARLIEQTEWRAQREARLNQIAQQLRQTSDVHSVLQAATEQLSLALDTSHAQAQLGLPRTAPQRPDGGQSGLAEDES